MRRSRGGLTPLGGALQETLKRLNLDTRAREMQALLVWAEVVGAQIAAVTEPQAVRDGVLHVVARSSTWASELTFHKQSILKGMNRRLGKGTLRDIRFRQGTIGDGREEDPEPEPQPTPEELAAIRLSAADRREIAAAVEAQPDTDLGEVVRRILEGERRRRYWRERHGERLCPTCGTLYRRAGATCPACRVEGRHE